MTSFVFSRADVWAPDFFSVDKGAHLIPCIQKDWELKLLAVVYVPFKNNIMRV